jgi:hypothetical protein
MAALLEALQVVWDPVGLFKRRLESPRFLWPLALLVGLYLTVPLTLIGRFEMRPSVLADVMSNPETASITDRELDEKVVQAGKLELAKEVAGALFGPPTRALVLTVGMWLLGRLLMGKPKFGVLFSLALAATLPLGLRAAARALVIHSQPRWEPAELLKLLPSGALEWWPALHAPWWQGLDFFRLWVAALLGVALGVSSQFGPVRASLGMGAAYAAWVALAFVGFAHGGAP